MCALAGTKRHATTAGFTLLEVLVVMAILAVVAAISVPALQRGSKKAPDAIARDVQMLLWQARLRAIVRGQDETVLIDVPNRTLRYPTDDESIEIPDDMSFSMLVGRELLAQEKQAAIIFFPDGASTGAEIHIGEASGDGVTVVVPWLTGIPAVFAAP